MLYNGLELLKNFKEVFQLLYYTAVFFSVDVLQQNLILMMGDLLDTATYLYVYLFCNRLLRWCNEYIVP